MKTNIKELLSIVIVVSLIGLIIYACISAINSDEQKAIKQDKKVVHKEWTKVHDFDHDCDYVIIAGKVLVWQGTNLLGVAQ